MTWTRVPSLTTMRCGRSAGRASRASSAGSAALAQAGLGAFQGALEALGAEGLQQVVHGVGVEGAHRVLVVGGDEDDRGARGSISSSTSKPSSLGIWTSRKSRSGMRFGDRLDRFEAVGAFGDDFDFRMGGEQFAQDIRGPVPRRRR